MKEVLLQVVSGLGAITLPAIMFVVSIWILLDMLKETFDEFKRGRK
jgi:hypothetical protein